MIIPQPCILKIKPAAAPTGASGIQARPFQGQGETTRYGAISRICGTTPTLDNVTMATAIGSLKRRGPALPGFM
jgi:hypothetical protein